MLKQQSSREGAGSVHIVEHRHSELETSPPLPYHRWHRLPAINLTPLTLCVPTRTLRPVVIVVSQNPRVYCYLYSGNYQFAGIHYGIRDEFDDLEMPVCRARTHRNTHVGANYARFAWHIFIRFETTNRISVARRRLSRAINDVLIQRIYLSQPRLQNPGYCILWLDFPIEIYGQRYTRL